VVGVGVSVASAEQFPAPAPEAGEPHPFPAARAPVDETNRRQCLFASCRLAGESGGHRRVSKTLRRLGNRKLRWRVQAKQKVVEAEEREKGKKKRKRKRA
ncbi:hypothetical protein BHE74_00059226, partial [Ensete ventricosum]